MARSALMNVMVNAAMKAGRGLTRDFGEVENLQVSRKGPADFVTVADKRAEKVVMDELYTAEKGNGAWLNNRRLRVASRKHMSEAVLSTGINSQGRALDTLQLRQLAHITPAVAGIRRSGSISIDLAWLASGRFDGVWEAGLKPWDVAPGLLMVKEAGGFVSDFAGGVNSIDKGEVVAGNEPIQSALLKAIQAVN